MTLNRRARLLRLAQARHDLLALAVLAPNKPWTPVDDYRIFTGIKGLRWVA